MISVPSLQQVRRIESEGWFSLNEYQARLSHVRAAMAARGLDGLVVFSPANTYYLTGHHSIDSWEFRAVVVTHDKPPETLLFHFELGRFLASSWIDDARYYGPGDAPISKLSAMIAESGLAAGRLGIETNSPVANEEARKQLAASLPDAQWVSASKLIADIRLCKSEQELAAIEHAASLTELGMQAAVDSAIGNATDNEVAAAAAHAMLAAGSHNLVMMPTIAVGKRSGLAHSEHVGRRIAEGDSVFLELSACWRHYSAPLMKTIFVGDPPRAWENMLQVAADTANAIIQTAKPGVPAQQVARAAHQAMSSIEHEVQYHFNFGYSVGISYPPHWLEDGGFYLTESNPEPIRAGMVFHLPLTFRVLGACAAGLSHTIAITENGVRTLTGVGR